VNLILCKLQQQNETDKILRRTSGHWQGIAGRKEFNLIREKGNYLNLHTD